MSAGRIPRAARGAVLALALATPAALAAPYTPASDDVVLERLPAAANALVRELAAERRALARKPHDLSRAAALAWRYLEASRSEADPRYAGLAEGVIAPWLADAEPPAEALLLRATLRQHRHDFAGAERDLAALLARSPRNAQAWLTRAVVAKVRGELALARASCAALVRLADALTATTCLADVASLSGRSGAAARALAAALERAPNAPAPQRQWALATLAEIHERRGEPRAAEASYQDALALARDAYTVSAYADFLLAAERPRDALALLGEGPRADGLLLRRALAQRALHAPGLEATLRELRARFAATRLRGERGHAGEEARFALAFGDAREALALARASFAVQREPRDVRVLLEAALAVRDPAAAEPALALLAATQLEDARLEALAARVRSLR
jgi:hypothetical protein